jgi:ATP-dependent Clp protease ATP-binding subunit ClpC
MKEELLTGFNARARRVVAIAEREARAVGHGSVDTEHILLGLVGEGEGIGVKALESLGITPDDVRAELSRNLRVGRSGVSRQTGLTARARKVLDYSRREAALLRHQSIGTEHLLLGLLSQGEGTAHQVLTGLGADLARVRQQVIQLRHGYQGRRPERWWFPGPAGGYQEPGPQPVPGGPGDPGRLAEPSGTAVPGSQPGQHGALDRFGVDLTARARDGSPAAVPGWADETGLLLRALAQPAGHNPVLVGGTAAGRLPLAQALARELGKDTAPETVRNRSLRYLDLAALAPAGQGDSSNPAPVQDGALLAVLTEAQLRPDALLFLDNLPAVLDDTGNQAVLAQGLAPLLATGQPQIIGAARLDDYRRCLRQDALLIRQLQPVHITDAMVAYTIGVLKTALHAAARCTIPGSS